MAPVRNARALFNEIPKGYPDPEKTVVYDESETIDIETVALNGGVLVKVLYLSIDPYLRGKMRESEKKTYNDAFVVGEPLSAHGVGSIVKTENTSYKVGDHIYGLFKFAEYLVIEELNGFRKIPNEENIPLSVYIGVAGMPGQTAYYGWKAYAKPKKGETVFVTTGAGPVGSTVIQLAKLDGLKVIASAGSDEKVQFMKDIGADVAFNYKTTSTEEILSEHGPIDIYWDHVGGEILDIALTHAALHARFIEVGLISGYNTGFQPLKNYANILFKSITVQGFIVSNLAKDYQDRFYKEFPGLIASKEIKYLEYRKKGLQNAGQLLVDVLKGHNVGKAVIVVSEQ